MRKSNNPVSVNTTVILSHLSTEELVQFLSYSYQSKRLAFTILQLYSACSFMQHREIKNCYISGKIMGKNKEIKNMLFVNVDFSTAEGLEELRFENCRFENCTFRECSTAHAANPLRQNSYPSLPSGFFGRRKSSFGQNGSASSFGADQQVEPTQQFRFNLPTFTSA